MAKPESKIVPIQAGPLTTTTLSEEMEREAQGVGVSMAPEDRIVPFALILQKNSPQVDRGSDRYVDGAEPGDILLTGAVPPVVKGGVGVSFQCCHVTMSYPEWRPRKAGGGLVTRHATQPAAAEERPDPDNPQKTSLVLPSGNVIVPTRYLAGHVVDEASGDLFPYVLSLYSTGHTFYRMLNNYLTARRTPQGNRVNMWYVLFRLTTKRLSNVMGTWYGWTFDDRGFVSPTLAARGKELYEALSRGEKEIAAEDDVVAAAKVDDEIPF